MTTPSISPDIDIVSVERRTKPGMAASLVFGWDAQPDEHGYAVQVRFSDGHEAAYSRLDGGHWRCDGEFGPTGLPRYFNGTFSVLSCRADEMADVLDAAVDAA